MGWRVQQPPKEQVATKTEKERKSATVIICYAVSPEERIEPKYYYLAHIWGKYLRKVTLFFKFGPLHPVQATLENQVETSDIPPSKVRHQLWKCLIRDNHQSVRPWGTTTNGTDRDAKKALLWHLQRSQMPHFFERALHMVERTTTDVRQQHLLIGTSVPTPGKQNINQ